MEYKTANESVIMYTNRLDHNYRINLLPSGNNADFVQFVLTQIPAIHNHCNYLMTIREETVKEMQSRDMLLIISKLANLVTFPEVYDIFFRPCDEFPPLFVSILSIGFLEKQFEIYEILIKRNFHSIEPMLAYGFCPYFMESLLNHQNRFISSLASYIFEDSIYARASFLQNNVLDQILLHLDLASDIESKKNFSHASSEIVACYLYQYSVSLEKGQPEYDLLSFMPIIFNICIKLFDTLPFYERKSLYYGIVGFLVQHPQYIQRFMNINFMVGAQPSELIHFYMMTIGVITDVEFFSVFVDEASGVASQHISNSSIGNEACKLLLSCLEYSEDFEVGCVFDFDVIIPALCAMLVDGSFKTKRNASLTLAKALTVLELDDFPLIPEESCFQFIGCIDCTSQNDERVAIDLLTGVIVASREKKEWLDLFIGCGIEEKIEELKSSENPTVRFLLDEKLCPLIEKLDQSQ